MLIHIHMLCNIHAWMQNKRWGCEFILGTEMIRLNEHQAFLLQITQGLSVPLARSNGAFSSTTQIATVWGPSNRFVAI